MHGREAVTVIANNPECTCIAESSLDEGLACPIIIAKQSEYGLPRTACRGVVSI